MRYPLAGAPFPLPWIIGADISETARACRVTSHASDKLYRKSLTQVAGDLQCTQSLARECDVERSLWQCGLDRVRYWNLRQPGARSGRILDAQQKKTSFGQVLICEPHQALNIVQFHGPALAQDCAHSSLNQA